MLPSFRLIAATFCCGFLMGFAGLRLAATFNSVNQALPVMAAHAAAVLVMGPVAATLAHNLGYQVDPFLMAVALGAPSDFLSPIGHQNNALVMGPGGYRF